MQFSSSKIACRRASKGIRSAAPPKPGTMHKWGIPARWGIAALLAGICLFGVSGAARANTVFASFQNADFEFANTGTAATTGLFSTGPSLQVIFQFDEAVTGDGISYAPDQPIKATATLSSQVADTVTGTRILDQPLETGSLEFKDQFGNNLLTVSGFTADLTGINGGSTANVGTDTTLPSFPDVGTYSSDFLKFTPANDVVSSTSLTLDLNGTLTVAGNSYLNNFTANADGSFAGNAAAVPEPSGLCFAGLTGMGLLMRRKRTITA